MAREWTCIGRFRHGGTCADARDAYRRESFDHPSCGGGPYSPSIARIFMPAPLPPEHEHERDRLPWKPLSRRRKRVPLVLPNRTFTGIPPAELRGHGIAKQRIAPAQPYFSGCGRGGVTAMIEHYTVTKSVVYQFNGNIPISSILKAVRRPLGLTTERRSSPAEYSQDSRPRRDRLSPGEDRVRDTWCRTLSKS